MALQTLKNKESKNARLRDEKMTMSEMSVKDETDENSDEADCLNFARNHLNYQIQHNLTIKLILFRIIPHKQQG